MVEDVTWLSYRLFRERTGPLYVQLVPDTDSYTTLYHELVLRFF